MVNYTYKDLFEVDSIKREIVIKVDDGRTLDENCIISESFRLEEMTCDDDCIIFGKCISSEVSFTAKSGVGALAGHYITVNCVIDNKSDEPLEIGKYKVLKDDLSSNKKSRKVVAYDKLHEIINSDLAEWYQSILPGKDDTVTMLQFRNSLFSYLGIEQESISLMNDAMIIHKTVDPEELSGKVVLERICEINGCFGGLGRNGKFRYYTLNGSGTEIEDYISCNYSDYTCRAIDKLQIREKEGDIGVIVGTGENHYIVEDNFLVYGMGTSELQVVAQNLYTAISGIEYVPFEMKKKGNPCFEVGDKITIRLTDGSFITSFILKREIKGIQSLKDIWSADGVESRTEKTTGIEKEVLRLKGKSNVLERSIEETKSTIKDVESGLQTKITQNASSISAEITRATGAETGLSNRISATESKFSVKIEEIQKEIDGEIVTYNVPYVPTLLNYPAWDFTYNIPCDGTVACTDVPMIYNDEYYSRNARSVAFNVVTSMSYRFTKGENGEWYWRDIGDTDFGIAMQKIAELEITTDSISTTVEQNQTYNNQQISSLSSRITQTAESITSEVSRATQAEGNLSSRITQNADAINLRVQKGSIISEINQTAESVTIKANRIDLVGLVNATEFTSKYATIDSLNATNISVSGKASVGDLNALSARVGNLEVAGYITAKDVNGNVTSISGSAITTGKISADRLDINTIQSSINRLGSVTAGSINSEYTTLHDSFYLWNGNKKYKISVKYNVSLGYYLSATWENV